MPGKALEVYIQPAQWKGAKEEAPMKKLVVTLDHQSGGLPTRAVTAMKQPDHCKVLHISDIMIDILNVRCRDNSVPDWATDNFRRRDSTGF